MPRCPFAEWRGPVPNRRLGGMVAQPHGLVPHVIVGSLRSADMIFHQAAQQKSAHFGVGKDGRLVQWVDTLDVAWAEAAGNSWWWSAECEGMDTEPHTPAQIDALAHLVVWLRTLSPFPLQVTDDTSGFGIISHRNGGAPWGGHSCPGDKRHMQRADIVNRAKALELPPSEVTPMYSPPLPPTCASQACTTGGVWLLSPQGAVGAIEGAPFAGAPFGKPYFAGRTAARFAKPDEFTAAEKAAGKSYVVLDTAGNHYAYPE